MYSPGDGPPDVADVRACCELGTRKFPKRVEIDIVDSLSKQNGYQLFNESAQQCLQGGFPVRQSLVIRALTRDSTIDIGVILSYLSCAC
jgi:hypothetical protein